MGKTNSWWPLLWFTRLGTVYTESGDYAQSFERDGACDSLINLHLIINPSPVVEIVAEENSLTATVGFSTYQWISCSDLSEIPCANANIFEAGVSGEYAAIATTAAGCTDS